MPDNVCSSCLNLNIKCVHTKLQQKRGPKPGSTRTAASHSVHVLVAAILHGTQSDPFDVPDDKETVLKILVKLASRIKSLERELATSHRRLHNASSNSSPATVSSSQPSPEANADESSDDGDEIDNLSTAVARFSLSFPKQTHFGESSNLMIVMAAMDYQKEVTSNFTLWQSILSNVRRPTFWENPSWAVRPAQTFPTFEFPDQATLHKLIDSHFTELNLYFPLLHRPTFQRSLAGGLHLRDPAFGALVLMVCACGSVFAYPQHPRGDTKTSGWQWFNQVPFEKLVFSENLSLYHLQAYCLAIYYLEQVEITLRPDMSWLLS
ncbi:Gypsy retrotransposon integrase-like protein 1, partial [Stygiomarasmius scandens]